jgi:hypothetical protein
MIALDSVQNKAAKFAHHRNESNWELLAQRRRIARICASFKAYTEERAWKDIGGGLQRPVGAVSPQLMFGCRWYAMICPFC